MIKKNTGLYIAIAFGIILAAYPIYGYPLSSALWNGGSDREEEQSITGTVEEVGSDYIVVMGEKIIFKGSWNYKGEILEYEDILANTHTGRG